VNRSLLALFAAAAFCAASHAQPNILVILNDDMGYADLGCFGADKIKTPRVDQLAKEGRRFTSFYVSSAVCSASRAALLTGCYPNRVGVKGVFFPNRGSHGLDPKHFTIAELLKSAGYKTLAAGKWHLGDEPKFLPTNQGFDTYYGVPYSNDMYPAENMKYAKDCLYREGVTQEKLKAAFDDMRAKKSNSPRTMKDKVPLMRDEECIEFPLDQRTITRRLADESIRFIKESVEEKKPFFVYLANPMPHTPLFVSEAFDGKSAQGIYGDVIEEIDHNTGRVLDALKENGVADNTLVIFTSDNGPWLIKKDHGGSAKPLRDGKGSSYDGGQRVPTIMRWPGKIPAGSVCDEVATAMDLMPTFAAIIGTGLPDDLELKPDGHDIRKLMTGGPDEKTPYTAFFYNRNSAVRYGKWKYRKGARYGHWSGVDKKLPNPQEEQLFNLEEDIGETTNLINERPEVAVRLKSFLSNSPNQARVMPLLELAPPAGTRYELEKGEVSGGAIARSRDVGSMQVKGAKVAINVDGGAGGKTDLVLAYASAGSSSLGFFVNGKEQTPLDLPKTGGWQRHRAVKFTIRLKPGQNKIEIRSGSGGANLDYLDVKPAK
jgi:arylsulfatase A-like enzyme